MAWQLPAEWPEVSARIGGKRTELFGSGTKLLPYQHYRLIAVCALPRQHQAGSNQSQGKGYNMAMSEWLHDHRMDDMDKKTLFEVIGNRVNIERWRAPQPQPPVLSAAQVQACGPPGTGRRAPRPPHLRDSVANLSEEVESKNRRIAELEAQLQEAQAAGDTTLPATVEDEDEDDSNPTPSNGTPAKERSAR
jgi:hypothetical protein